MQITPRAANRLRPFFSFTRTWGHFSRTNRRSLTAAAQSGSASRHTDRYIRETLAPPPSSPAYSQASSMSWIPRFFSRSLSSLVLPDWFAGVPAVPWHNLSFGSSSCHFSAASPLDFDRRTTSAGRSAAPPHPSTLFCACFYRGQLILVAVEFQLLPVTGVRSVCRRPLRSCVNFIHPEQPREMRQK